MKLTKLFIGGLIVAFVVMLSAPVFATPKTKPPTQEQHQKQYQEATAHSESTSESVSSATAHSESTSESASHSESAANNEGNALSVNTERSAPDVVLVPNNNTESCLRVFGFGGSSRDGSALFGIPFRSKACDYDKAGDDAAAIGDHNTAWFWRCHKKSLYKPFRDKDESKESAIEKCHARMVGGIESQKTVESLQQEIAFLQNERAIERDECNKAKNRIAEASRESNERVIDACNVK